MRQEEGIWSAVYRRSHLDPVDDDDEQTDEENKSPREPEPEVVLAYSSPTYAGFLALFDWCHAHKLTRDTIVVDRWPRKADLKGGPAVWGHPVKLAPRSCVAPLCRAEHKIVELPINDQI